MIIIVIYNINNDNTSNLAYQLDNDTYLTINNQFLHLGGILAPLSSRGQSGKTPVAKPEVRLVPVMEVS